MPNAGSSVAVKKQNLVETQTHQNFCLPRSTGNEVFTKSGKLPGFDSTPI